MTSRSKICAFKIKRKNFTWWGLSNRKKGNIFRNK